MKTIREIAGELSEDEATTRALVSFLCKSGVLVESGRRARPDGKGAPVKTFAATRDAQTKLVELADMLSSVVKGMQPPA